MAVIFPADPDYGNEAERKVYEYLKENLPDDYICYFKYYVKCREFDVAVMIPEKGIVVIEIKGWYAKNIIQVIDNNNIHYRIRGSMPHSLNSPLKQADQYRYHLVNKLKEEINKNVLVLGVVCYPNITKEEFHANRLDIISQEEITLLKDDLALEDLVRIKLDEAFKLFEGVTCDRMDPMTILEIRQLFEPSIEIQKVYKEVEDPQLAMVMPRNYYSILKYLSREQGNKEQTKENALLLEHWQRGSKITLISNDPLRLDQVRVELMVLIEALNLKKQLWDEKSNSFFNFNIIVHSGDLAESFSINNGEEQSQYSEYLETLDQETEFNLNQYRIEHAPIENIVVKAGAGTGKTYTMISRLWFLIYTLSLTVEQLKDALVLITFTQEAARVMKKRFQEYMERYYLLTLDQDVFRMIEALEDMKITTIHGLTKRIIQKFGVKFGLGNEIRIISGKYERNNILREVMDQYLGEHPTVKDKVNEVITLYKLQKYLKKIYEKLENQNIDIVGDYDKLDFGSCEYPEFNTLIKEVIYKTEVDVKKYSEENNLIFLSNLMIKLNFLTKGDRMEFIDMDVKCVFVDEFQDTDNVQINLLKHFQKLLDFKFFIVGDVKQCIYRFRGAEERAFDQLIPPTKPWEQDYPLNINYRTDQRLLERFHHIFTKWGEQKFLDYNPKDGYLKSYILTNQPEDDYFKKIEHSEDSFEEEFIRELNKRMDEVLGSKKQIAILVRENREVELIRKLGLKNGIFIQTDIGGSLYQSDPTLDFYKLVLALQYPTSPKHLYNLFTTSYVENDLRIAELYSLHQNRDELIAYFNNHSPISLWEGYLEELKREPILKVIRNIILAVKPWKNYAKRYQLQSAEKLETFYKKNLDQLFEQLSQRSNLDYLTINKIEKFLRVMIFTGQSEASREEFWVDNTKDQDVLCMTIHKAKGQEFHTVLLPFGNRDMLDMKKSGAADVIVKKGNEIGWKMRLDQKIEIKPRYQSLYLTNSLYQEEEEKHYRMKEETRILYVAMTRAEQNFTYFYDTGCNFKHSWQSIMGEEETM